MKITAHHNLITKSLNLIYDDEVQKALAESAQTVETFCSARKVRAMAGHRLPKLISKFGSAVETLHSIIKKDRDPLEVPVNDMQNLLGIMLLAANYQIAMRGSVSTLPQCLLILAKITPYGLPPIPLPPAIEVFDRSTISKGAWAGYESIRLWAGPGGPHLCLFELFELWVALEIEPSTDDLLRTFSHWLGENTLTFRVTMDLLAKAELGSNKPKSARNRKSK